MHAERSIDIAAPAERIFAMAGDVTRWPTLLPHYRWVKVIDDAPEGRVVAMAARRGVIPVRWTAVVQLDPRGPRINFRHLSGWTKGMDVAWLFERRGAGTRVTIVHDLDYRRYPLGGEWFGRRVVGDFFIQSIAGKTLARMKELAERERA